MLQRLFSFRLSVLACRVVLPWTTLASEVIVIFRTVLDATVRSAPAPYSCSVLTFEMCLLPGAGSGSGGGGGKSLFPGGCHRPACGVR